MTLNMKLGTRGLELIKRFETLRLTAYRPTPLDVPTIGYGHTEGVEMGDVCSMQEALVWLKEDVQWAEKVVNALNVSLSQSMFDALVSLVFNVGPSAVAARSYIWQALKQRSYFEAWSGIAKWRRQGRMNLRGLARRRAAEMVLFMEDPLP